MAIVFFATPTQHPWRLRPSSSTLIAYKLGWLHTRTPCALHSTSLPAAAMHNGAKRKEPFRTPRVMQRFSTNAIALVKEKHMSRKTCVL